MLLARIFCNLGLEKLKSLAKATLAFEVVRSEIVFRIQ